MATKNFIHPSIYLSIYFIYIYINKDFEYEPIFVNLLDS